MRSASRSCSPARFLRSTRPACWTVTDAPPRIVLYQELKERKKELLEAQRVRKDTLKRQIRRAQSRISAAERKRRTRRLILMGSYLEHVTGDDPDKRDRLIKGLDVFLERDRDRELFDLAPNKENADGNPD